MARLKRCNIEVKGEMNCMTHALIIAIAKLTNNPDYKAYIQARKIPSVVQNSLETTGIDLTKGGVIPKLERFQDHFREYKIVVDG